MGVGAYPGLLGLEAGRRVRIRDRLEDAMLLALKMEKEATGQGWEKLGKASEPFLTSSLEPGE